MSFVTSSIRTGMLIVAIPNRWHWIDQIAWMCAEYSLFTMVFYCAANNCKSYKFVLVIYGMSCHIAFATKHYLNQLLLSNAQSFFFFSGIFTYPFIFACYLRFQFIYAHFHFIAHICYDTYRRYIIFNTRFAISIFCNAYLYITICYHPRD